MAIAWVLRKPQITSALIGASSVSQLEEYASCPYQFFAERVLQLEPLGTLALESDFAQRGQMLHGALSRVHQQLNEARGGPTSPLAQTPAEFERAAAEVLLALVAQLPTDEPIEKALGEVDRRMLAEWLQNYYSQHQEYDQLWADFEAPLKPAHFEVPFGPLSESMEADPNEVPVEQDYPAART